MALVDGLGVGMVVVTTTTTPVLTTTPTTMIMNGDSCSDDGAVLSIALFSGNGIGNAPLLFGIARTFGHSPQGQRNQTI